MYFVTLSAIMFFSTQTEKDEVCFSSCLCLLQVRRLYDLGIAFEKKAEQPKVTFKSNT